MARLNVDAPGTEMLLMGNEAIARGALEAGISVAAAYPGNPSSEIIGSLAGVAAEMGIYVEWSINEKVALEVAAAASMSGLNAIAAMKQNGLNVAADFLFNLTLTGIRGGLVLVVCDDPSGISSTNEQDSRAFAKPADIPLFEPATFNEAKEMVIKAFELSREIGNICFVRGVTRISHARGNVTLGELPKSRPKPWFDTSQILSSLPASIGHPKAHRRLKQGGEILKHSPFNSYQGPDDPELIVVTCGSGWMFSMEAVSILELDARVGLLKLGTTWPLPEELLLEHLKKTSKVLFIEEVDPILETNVKAFYADHNHELPQIRFFGKASGHAHEVGELDPSVVMEVLSKVTGAALPQPDPLYAEAAKDVPRDFAPHRALAFCPGCPHRASYWAIKKALVLDGRDGVLFGDIGCYALAVLGTGFHQNKTLHAMGSGAGLACGFGVLGKFGATQPALAVCGDSTFYHAGIPPLINALHHRSDFLLLILDNSATAMTGFQPHPGSPVDAMGKQAPPIVLEDLCRSLGVKTVIKDPFQLEEATNAIYELLQESGTKVLILRQECALVRAKTGPKRYHVSIDPTKCIGEECGCNRLCTRVFRCPGLNWDNHLGKSKIDEAICTGCGVCADICPQGAIVRGVGQ